jgi:hypothetical protein
LTNAPDGHTYYVEHKGVYTFLCHPPLEKGGRRGIFSGILKSPLTPLYRRGANKVLLGVIVGAKGLNLAD